MRNRIGLGTGDGQAVFHISCYDGYPLATVFAFRARSSDRQQYQLATEAHGPADDMVPFADTQELLRNSGLDESALIVVGNDHRLANSEPLAVMAGAVEARATASRPHH